MVLGATAPVVVGVSWLVWWLVADSRRERRQALAAARSAQQYRARRGGPEPASRPRRDTAKVSVAELLERAIRERQATRLNWPTEDPTRPGRIRPYAQDQFPTSQLPKIEYGKHHTRGEE